MFSICTVVLHPDKEFLYTFGVRLHYMSLKTKTFGHNSNAVGCNYVNRTIVIAERCPPLCDFGPESARWTCRRPGCCQLTRLRSFLSSFCSNTVLIQFCLASTISWKTKARKFMKVSAEQIKEFRKITVLLLPAGLFGHGIFMTWYRCFPAWLVS